MKERGHDRFEFIELQATAVKCKLLVCRFSLFAFKHMHIFVIGKAKASRELPNKV